jgi:phosphoglucomutase
VTAKAGRRLFEVPVGFKWFCSGLMDGTLGFGGEESAGASFLRRNGAVWTTDKDGLIMGLLAAEMTARTGKDPNQVYLAATSDLGKSYYERIDAPASPEQKSLLAKLDPAGTEMTELAGEPIEAKLSRAPGNGEAIGGIKVVTANGWFAARPSGTENVYKLYAESFRSEEHLRAVQRDAQAFILRALNKR